MCHCILGYNVVMHAVHVLLYSIVDIVSLCVCFRWYVMFSMLNFTSVVTESLYKNYRERYVRM